MRALHGSEGVGESPTKKVTDKFHEGVFVPDSTALGLFKGEVVARSRNAVIEKRSQSMVFVAEDVIEEPGTDVDVCCMECQKIVGSSARAA